MCGCDYCCERGPAVAGCCPPCDMATANGAAASDDVSLRDEVASVLLDNGWTCEYHEPDAYCGECRRLYAVTADAVLAVARKHYRERAEGLISWDSNGNPVIDRRDVLALFGGES